MPGWDGECEWTGTVPFGEMPRVIDPAGGFVLTANNVIVDGDEPYISATFAQPFRAEQIRERLADAVAHTTEGLAAMQADTVSWAARAWGRRVLGGLGCGDTSAEAACVMLSGWDGDLAAGSARALLYGCFQRALAEGLYRPLAGESHLGVACLGNLTADDHAGPAVAGQRHLGTARRPGARALGRQRGQRVLAAVPAALASAWAAAVPLRRPGPGPLALGDVHRAERRHLLAGQLELTLPAPVRMGGDADTLQASGYGWAPDAGFDVTSLSVYRQVVDLGQVRRGQLCDTGRKFG